MKLAHFKNADGVEFVSNLLGILSRDKKYMRTTVVPHFNARVFRQSDVQNEWEENTHTHILCVEVS